VIYYIVSRSVKSGGHAPLEKGTEMSRNEISRKTRIMADSLARERLGLSPDDYIRPEYKRDYNIERARALRTLTQGQTYYTAASFPAL
jgi:hypothetical protein